MPINRKKELDRAAIKCIALDLRCFNDFRKEGIKIVLFRLAIFDIGQKAYSTNYILIFDEFTIGFTQQRSIFH